MGFLADELKRLLKKYSDLQKREMPGWHFGGCPGKKESVKSTEKKDNNMEETKAEKDIRIFVEYVTANIESIGIQPYGTGTVSEKEFEDVIHRYLGRSCTFFISANGFYFTPERIIIIDTDSHREVLHIDGRIGGDVYVGMDICFEPLIFFHGHTVFYKGKNVGKIRDDRQCDFDFKTGALYLITYESLKKIDSRGNVVWETPLARNTQCTVFKIYLRPDSTYTEEKLVQIVIDDDYALLYKDSTGELYDTLYLRRRRSESYELGAPDEK